MKVKWRDFMKGIMGENLGLFMSKGGVKMMKNGVLSILSLGG